MSYSLNAQDVYALLNLVARQATGEASMSATDTSSFVSVGQTVLQTGTENTLNAINTVLGKLRVSVRSVSDELNLIAVRDSGEFAQRIRQISFYSKGAMPEGSWNTQLYTNLATGYDAGTNSGKSTKDMWEQNPQMPLEMDFSSINVWELCDTRYEKALKVAFTSEEEFARFISGWAVEFGNQLTRHINAYRRMTLLNYMAGLYDVNALGSTGQAVNLTAAFNTKYGTNYSSADLLPGGAHFKDFLKFFASTIKLYSLYMREDNNQNHWTVPKTVGSDTYEILRNVPASEQRLLLYAPMLVDAQTEIFPEIFNEEYLQIENYEGVTFWQSPKSRDAINVVPAIPDVKGSTGLQIKGNAVQLDHVLGVLFDKEACYDNQMFEDAITTPVEGRKRYINTWHHYAHGSYNDFTQKGILFYMADPEGGGQSG